MRFIEARISYYTIAAYIVCGALAFGFFPETPLLIGNALLWIAFGAVAMRGGIGRLTGLQVWSLAWLLLYAVSLFYAYNAEAALIGFWKMAGVFPLLAMFLQLDTKRRSRLFRFLPWTGAGIAALGVALELYRNGRLESTFAYANGFAIFLLCGALVAVATYGTHRRTMYLIPAACCFCGMFLSLSRGTWIVALATIALAIFLLKPDRSRFLLGVAIAAAAGFAAAAAISRSALFFLPRWREAAEGAPEFSIRLTYWRDSLQMIRDHLWFGTGEGGWALLQSAYRSESYYVAYVHNHYVQLLLDVGVVGLLLFLGGTAWHGGRVLRRLLSGESQEGRTRAGLATLLSFALLFHAGADITLQFPLLFALLLLALAWTEERSPLPTAGRARSYGAATLAFLFAFLQLWAAAGYIDKTQGMKAGRNGAFAEGEERLQRAEAMLPWASSPAYELAKLYVRRGNETGSAEDYRAAKEALERALLLLPEHTEYAALLEELHTIIGNNEGGEPFE